MLKYTKDHEWVKLESENVVSVGITSHAAEALGTLVYVELPKIGKQFKVGEEFAVVESSKSASDVYAPVSGKVIEANSNLEASPELINSAQDGEVWIAKFELADPKDLEACMTFQQYQETLK